MDDPTLDMSQLWDAAAYLQDGKCPWTIFAFPKSLADDRQLPRDDESVRYLKALVAAGAKVGLWYLPANETVYFACPFEEREHVAALVDQLERQGTFPKHFARDGTEYMFQIASTQRSPSLPLMRYSLRTLLILTILGPPALAAAWFAPFLVWYFAAILLAAFVMFLGALSVTAMIRILVGLWDR